MWCERVIRNAADDDLAGRALDYVDIRWDECRQVLRTRSRNGQEIRVLLPRGQKLRHGDVLFEDAQQLVVINVLPCMVIVVHCDQPRLLAELALALGNLHWPTQVGQSELIFIEEQTALAAVAKLGLRALTEHRRFEPLPVRAAVNVKLSDGLRVLRPGQDQIDDARRRKVASSV
jgi:urease accessory protein